MPSNLNDTSSSPLNDTSQSPGVKILEDKILTLNDVEGGESLTWKVVMRGDKLVQVFIKNTHKSDDPYQPGSEYIGDLRDIIHRSNIGDDGMTRYIPTNSYVDIDPFGNPWADPLDMPTPNPNTSVQTGLDIMSQMSQRTDVAVQQAISEMAANGSTVEEITNLFLG
jgi:hypothetical protein